MEGPWAPRTAGVKAAAAEQKKSGAGTHYPSVAFLALAKLRAWDRFGVLGAQLMNTAEVLEVALKTNQEAEAKLA